MKTGSTLPPGSRNRGTTVVTLDQNMVAEIGQDEGITDALTGTGLADLPCGRPRQVLCRSARFFLSKFRITCNNLKIDASGR
jgi:hypothetical protein